MKRLLVAIVAALAVVFPSLGIAGAGDLYSPKLSRIASAEAHMPIRVVSHDYGANMIGGETFQSKGLIYLAPDVVHALLRAPQLTVDPPDSQTDSGTAVFMLAHEVGHMQDKNLAEEMSTDGSQESVADCYAAHHWKRYALAVGFGEPQLGILAKQIKASGGECWH